MEHIAERASTALAALAAKDELLLDARAVQAAAAAVAHYLVGSSVLNDNPSARPAWQNPCHADVAARLMQQKLHGQPVMTKKQLSEAAGQIFSSMDERWPELMRALATHGQSLALLHSPC